MDAYSISLASPSRRNTSRIYQDLRAIRTQNVLGLHKGGIRKAFNMATGGDKVNTMPARSSPW